MTPEEAISELYKHSQLILVARNPKLNKAVKLGIEALRLNKSMRETYPHPELLKLPGETKD